MNFKEARIIPRLGYCFKHATLAAGASFHARAQRRKEKLDAFLCVFALWREI
ncbi:MAG: hypothetical protein JO360_07210 [Acidobacteria bacterium]|nr:hypothetical protein [Acidobacteriota bacterium]